MVKKVQKTLSIAVETSGRAGSVAIGQNGQVLAETRFTSHLRHSAELLTTAKQLLDDVGMTVQQVGKIYCIIGPGSFTGLRISATMAKMFEMATSAKIIAVNTMDALALNASDYQTDTSTQVSRIATVIDAKRGSFFITVFQWQGDQWIRTIDDRVMKSEEFLSEFANSDPIWLLGEGLVYYKEDFTEKNIKFLPEEYWPARAKNVFRIGESMSEKEEFSDARTLTPLYLRGTGAKPKKGMKPPK
jgi:tRNA threonylcarbamoyladenosine biosynthesis protein TsaB